MVALGCGAHSAPHPSALPEPLPATRGGEGCESHRNAPNEKPTSESGGREGHAGYLPQ
jgi:hypothetical protein